jgi:hypothetical protein
MRQKITIEHILSYLIVALALMHCCVIVIYVILSHLTTISFPTAFCGQTINMDNDVRHRIIPVSPVIIHSDMCPEGLQISEVRVSQNPTRLVQERSGNTAGFRWQCRILKYELPAPLPLSGCEQEIGRESEVSDLRSSQC